jgi:hypothetical protein
LNSRRSARLLEASDKHKEEPPVIDHLDFAAGPAVLASVLAVGLFPVILAVLSRLPGLRDRNALQFLASSGAVVGLWGIALHAHSGPAATGVELATSFMILAGALLAYLEAWAILSRGYTLGLLLTLFRGKLPMTDAELSANYRQGQGLGWIMRHRLGGLLSTRLVRRQGDLVALTLFGLVIARLYRAAIAFLGLKVTG